MIIDHEHYVDDEFLIFMMFFVMIKVMMMLFMIMMKAVMVLLLFKCFFTCAHVGQLMVVTMIGNYGAVVILLLHLLLQHASKLFLDYVQDCQEYEDL